MNVIFYLASAGFLVFAALFIRWACRMARRNGKRIASHGVTLPPRKRRRYSATELLNLSRPEVDPHWERDKREVDALLADLDDLPPEHDPCITKPRSEGEPP